MRVHYGMYRGLTPYAQELEPLTDTCCLSNLLTLLSSLGENVMTPCSCLLPNLLASISQDASSGGANPSCIVSTSLLE